MTLLYHVPSLLNALTALVKRQFVSKPILAQEWGKGCLFSLFVATLIVGGAGR